MVLVKAAIEAGGVETLSKSNAWVRNLLAILKRPDPPMTRALVVITLTRIFMLTWEYTNLIREITTPSLPAFVSTCLSNGDNQHCSAQELQTILESFATLIPRHPTIFRSSESQIHNLLIRIVSDSHENRHFNRAHREVANRVMVLLHQCAPKQGSAAKWDESYGNVIAATHATCDSLFRSIVEDWQTTAGVRPFAQMQVLLDGEVRLENPDNLAGLPGWYGIEAGCERLIALLDMLQSHLDTATAALVTVRLGLLTDLLNRVFSVTVSDGMKANSQVAGDERAALLSFLPATHVAGIELVHTVLTRFGKAAASTLQSFLSQVAWVFQAEKEHALVRSAVYAVTEKFLEIHGPSMTKADVSEIEPVIKSCCEDLLPLSDTTASTSGATANVINGDIGVQQMKGLSKRSASPGGLTRAAELLLPVLIGTIDPLHISGRLRAQLERTAVLIPHQEALLACVLNPASTGNQSTIQASLLPLLARQFPSSVEVETLLRPRMPVIMKGQKVKHGEVDEDNDEEDEEEADDEYASVADGGASSSGDVRDEIMDGNGVNIVHVVVDVEQPTPSQSPPETVSGLAMPEKRSAPPAQFDFSQFTSKRQRISTDSERAAPIGKDTLPAPTGTEADRSSTVSNAASLYQLSTQEPVTVPMGALPTPSLLAPDEDEDDDDEEMVIPELTMEESSDDD